MSWIIAFALLCQIAACLFSAAVMVRRARPVAIATLDDQQPLTFVVAIARLSPPEVETALLCAQYLRPPHRLIYCAEHPDEPAAQQVSAALRATGLADNSGQITLLSQPDQHSANPKLDIVAQGYAAAQTDHIVFVDGNLAATADIAARVNAVWSRDVAVVSTTPVAVDAQSLWAQTEAATINLSHARWMLAGDTIGLQNAHGKLLALRKSWLETNGGFDVLSQYSAEDSALTALVARTKGRLRLTQASLAMPLGRRRLDQVLGRNLRWRRIRATDRPGVYIAEACNALWSLLVTTTVLAALEGWQVLPLVLTLIVLWQILEGGILAASGLGWSWRAQAGIILRDLAEPFLWLVGWLPLRTAWRGNAD